MEGSRATKTAAARRSAILAVAFEAFIQDGYAGTSMSSIAARLGGSKGTLYNYFSSKEELLAAVVREKGEVVYAQLTEIPTGRPDLRKTLTQIGLKLGQIMLSSEFLAFYRLAVAEAGRFPEIGAAVYEMGERLALTPLTDFLKSAIANGKLRACDPLEAAQLFVDLCGAVAHRRRLLAIPPETDAAEIRRNVERAVSLFLTEYGVGK